MTNFLSAHRAALVLVVMVVVPPAQASRCPAPVSFMPDLPTATNCVYDVVQSDRMGSFSAGTGVEHPVTLALGGRHTLPVGGGRLLSPFEHQVAIRSWDTATDYRFDYHFAGDTLLEDRGFRCVRAIDLPAPILEPIDRSDGQVVGLQSVFDVDEAGDRLRVTVRIVAQGEVFEDSAVEVTTVVENVGPAEARLGVRYFWDVGMVGASEIALGRVPPVYLSEPWEIDEGEWFHPAFDHMLAAWTAWPSVDDPYYLGGISVGGPWSLDPAPTVPDWIVRSKAVAGFDPARRDGPGNTCFAWEVPAPPRNGPPPGPGDGGGPEAMCYYWGRTDDTALVLAPGESRSFTVWFWAFLQNPITCDAGPPQAVECTGAVTRARLDGSGSHALEGTPLRHRWTSADPVVTFDDATLAQPVASLPGVGTHELTLEAGIGPYARTCETTVEVVDTTPPVLDVPADVVLRTSDHGPDACALAATLTATATDSCSSSVVITHATEPDVGAGGAVASHVFPPGTTRVVFTARDEQGNEAVGEARVTVIDDTPPVIRVLAAVPAVLWPPNHRLRDVSVRVDVSDNCDAAPSITLLDVTSSEPEDATGDGHTAADVAGALLGTADLEVRLRAERDGAGEGRTYALRYGAEDDWGNRTEGTVLVIVPHDRGGGG